MEARATQHILSALPEMMRHRRSRKVSPTLSPALHLPLTAVTSILVIRNALLHGHDSTSSNAAACLQVARPLHRPDADTEIRATDNIHACLTSVCQPGILSSGHCRPGMLALVVRTSTEPGGDGPAMPTAPASRGSCGVTPC
jgi:hypothetical protein